MNSQIQRSFLTVLFIALPINPFASVLGYTPTSEYKVKSIVGFKVYVSPKCYEPSKRKANKALDILRIKLEEVNRLVPQKQLETLHKVPLWIELNNRSKFSPDSNSCYHAGDGWLKTHGENPDKANSVEIPIENDLTPGIAFRDQRMFVLHELTHAYHHQIVGHNNPDVKAAFRQAKERKLYDKVPKVYFGKYEKLQRAYAMDNDMEYLTEITESYFGVNEWYPFTWEDLQRHDPVGWRLMEKTWGPLKRDEKAVELTVQNQTKNAAVLFWIKGDGNLKEYETIRPGNSIVRPTFSGHRWQVRLKGAEDRYFFVAPGDNTTWFVK